MFKELCLLLEIKKTRTSIHNPRCNRQVEHFNRTLLNIIKMYLKGEQENWDLNLGCLASTYWAAPQAATGLTPNLLIVGQEVRLPAEVVYGGISNHGNCITTYEKYVDVLRSHMLKAHCIAREHLRSCLIVRKLNDLIFEIQLSRNGKT